MFHFDSMGEQVTTSNVTVNTLQWMRENAKTKNCALQKCEWGQG